MELAPEYCISAARKTLKNDKTNPRNKDGKMDTKTLHFFSLSQIQVSFDYIEKKKGNKRKERKQDSYES